MELSMGCITCVSWSSWWYRQAYESFPLHPDLWYCSALDRKQTTAWDVEREATSHGTSNRRQRNGFDVYLLSRTMMSPTIKRYRRTGRTGSPKSLLAYRECEEAINDGRERLQAQISEYLNNTSRNDEKAWWSQTRRSKHVLWWLLCDLNRSRHILKTCLLALKRICQRSYRMVSMHLSCPFWTYPYNLCVWKTTPGTLRKCTFVFDFAEFKI
jgi:hypothetical protein